MTPQSTATAIDRLQAGMTLTRKECADAFTPILNRDFTGADVAWGALFALIHHRGATADESSGLIDAVLAYDQDLAAQLTAKITLDLPMPVVAITGSGKETFKTVNISTAAALVASAHPGVCVIKPAGRATSAVTGASDVLQALGIQLPGSLDEVVHMARRCRFGLFDYHLVARRYGPRYEDLFHNIHPLSHITPWLLVPIDLDAICFGVAEPRVHLASAAMVANGVRRANVLSTSFGGAGRIDELAPFGTATIATVADTVIGLENVDQPEPTPEQLNALSQRGAHAANASAILEALEGRAPQGLTDTVCANAGALLHLADVVADRHAGSSLARQLIETGAARRQLELVREASGSRAF